MLQTLRVYTADGCRHCQALLRDYQRRGVRFVEVILTTQPERMVELLHEATELRSADAPAHRW